MKNTCKIVSAILAVVLLLAISTPVFAETKTSTVSYEVPESFTWSVSESFTIGEGYIRITSNTSNLLDGSSIQISVTDSANKEYDDYSETYKLRVKSNNRYGYYKLLTDYHPAEPDESGSLYINKFPFVLIDTSVDNTKDADISSEWAVDDWGQSLKPTLAGTYTDTLTFTAELHSVND